MGLEKACNGDDWSRERFDALSCRGHGLCASDIAHTFAPPIPALGVTPFLFDIPTKIGVPTAGLNGKD